MLGGRGYVEEKRERFWPESENEEEEARYERRRTGDYSETISDSDEEKYATSQDDYADTDSSLYGQSSKSGCGSIGKLSQCSGGSVIGDGGGSNFYTSFWTKFKKCYRKFETAIVSTVIELVVGRPNEHNRILGMLKQASGRCLFSVVAYHEGNCVRSNGPHFHWWHDCIWNRSECKHIRCSIRPRDGKQHRTNSKDTAAYVHSILLYVQKGGRQCHFVKINNCNWASSNSIQAFQYHGTSWDTVHGTVPQIIDERTDQLRSNPPTMAKDSGLNNIPGTIPKEKRSGGKHVPREIEEFMMNYPTYPLRNILKTSFWLNSSYRYLLASDKIVRRAMLAIQKMTMSWTFENFYNIYLNNILVNGENHTLIFQKLGQSNIYFSILISYEKIIEVLKYQLGDDEIAIEQFFKDIFNIAEKKLPKKNTLYIVGEPSSGKNYIIDSLLAYYLNVGHVANYTKNCSFPFNDCKDRRLCLWNEPNFMPSAIETLKLLLGGDPCPANIKFEDHDIIPRTPIFMLSNTDVLRPESNEAFSERCISYLDWKALPFKKVNYKPTPLVWPYIFYKHGMISYLNEKFLSLIENEKL